MKRRLLALLMVTAVLIALPSNGQSPRPVRTAPSAYTSHAPILIDGNGNFTAANGVTGGIGALDNPYVFEGWEINDSQANGIEIRNSNASFVIHQVYVHASIGSYTAILLDHVTHARVDNATMSGGQTGLDAEVADEYVASNNTIVGARSGLVCRSCTNTTLSYNHINGTTEGMYIGGSPNVEVLGNVVSNSLDFGLRLDPSASPNVALRPVVKNNVFSHNGEGVYLYGPDRAVVERNVVSYNGIGIGLPYSSNNSLVRANEVLGSRQYGINVQNAVNTTIEENNLSHNQYGIYLRGDSGVRSFHNNFLNNSNQASDSLSVGAAWNLTYPQGGNYWSDYAGKDNCSGPDQTVCPSPDGIGDSPYSVVDLTEVDRYPLMEPYRPPIMSAPPGPLSIGIFASPANGSVPLAVTFTSHVEGGVPIYAYAWSFGDGSRETTPSPIHVFMAAGSFSVTLTVTDAEGDVAAATTTISVHPPQGAGGEGGIPIWVTPLAVAVALAVAAVVVWRRKKASH